MNRIVVAASSGRVSCMQLVPSDTISLPQQSHFPSSSGPPSVSSLSGSQSCTRASNSIPLQRDSHICRATSGDDGCSNVVNGGGDGGGHKLVFDPEYICPRSILNGDFRSSSGIATATAAAINLFGTQLAYGYLVNKCRGNESRNGSDTEGCP
jgi:hypothetical protein